MIGLQISYCIICMILMLICSLLLKLRRGKIGLDIFKRGIWHCGRLFSCSNKPLKKDIGNISNSVNSWPTPIFRIFAPSKTTDEPRPNISPRPLRPRTSSAGRGRLPAPSSAPIRGTRGDTPRPAPEGAPGNPRHRRFLPGFGPWRGWLLLPDLHRHFRIPSNCSLLTANC